MSNFLNIMTNFEIRKFVLIFGVPGIISGLSLRSTTHLFGVLSLLLGVALLLTIVNFSKIGANVSLAKAIFPICVLAVFVIVSYVVRMLISL